MKYSDYLEDYKSIVAPTVWFMKQSNGYYIYKSKTIFLGCIYLIF